MHCDGSLVGLGRCIPVRGFMEAWKYLMESEYSYVAKSVLRPCPTHTTLQRTAFAPLSGLGQGC